MRVKNALLSLCAISFVFNTHAAANSVDCAPQDYVAVRPWTRANNGDVTEAIVLATRVRPENEGEWRFRTIPVGNAVVTEMALWHSAAVGIVTFLNAPTPLRIDLTRQIKRLSLDTAADLTPKFLESPEFSESWTCAPEPWQEGQQKRNLDSALLKHMREAGFSVDSIKVDPWKYFHVRVDPGLYAPILEVLESEPVLPTMFDIWDRLNTELPAKLQGNLDTGKPSTPITTALFRQYRELDRSCAIYFDDVQPMREGVGWGSWILQYWLYYPFDVGGVGQHLHDSEHLFVEVDKLGGTVRRVIGAGHGSWAPNNIFHTFQKNATPVSLPLFAIVEYGKHATAPDIDRDGLFTPGVDANSYFDAAKVWGIRDTIGVTDSNIRSFAGMMMVPRQKGHALVPSTVASAFAGDWHRLQLGFPLPDSPQRRCNVVRLQNQQHQSCDGPLAGCAQGQIENHSDRRRVNNILKQAIYPPVSMRVMFTWMPTVSNNPAHSERSVRVLVGGAIEFSKLGMPIPGRIAGDAILDPPFECVGCAFDGVAVRYEWLTSNLIGLYGGLSWVQDDLPKEEIAGPNRALWATLGLLYEQPPIGWLHKLERGPFRRMLLKGQAGIMDNNTYGVTWDARVGISLMFLPANPRFGIRKETPNPY